jgi:hypothetical protein
MAEKAGKTEKAEKTEKMVFVVAVHKLVPMPKILGFIAENQIKATKAKMKAYKLFEVPVKEL